MRDGVKWFTVILAPKDLTKPPPIILTRTPYSAKQRTTRNTSPYFASVVPLIDLEYIYMQTSSKDMDAQSLRIILFRQHGSISNEFPDDFDEEQYTTNKNTEDRC